MLNNFFNKTAHPILNRYHHDRMVEGTHLVKEMDTIINRLSKNQTINSFQDDEYFAKFKETIRQNMAHKRTYSKGIMKKIINNDSWNDLIDGSQNNSLMKKSRNRQPYQIQRSKSLNSSKKIEKNKVNFPNLTTNSSESNKQINNIKKGPINMIQYFSPPIKSKKHSLLKTKNTKPSIKSSNQYRTRQLKWQSKHLSHYDEQDIQQLQAQL